MGFTGDFLSPRWREPQAVEPLIVRVDEAHRGVMARHLLRLDSQARFLRFGQHLRDEAVIAYAQRIDLDFDDVFAVLDEQLQVVALAHVAYSREALKSEAEFGVSVDAAQRGRGLGYALLRRAIVHARWREVDRFFLQSLAENVAMTGLARKAGLTLEVRGDELTGYSTLPANDFANTLDDVLAARRAEAELSRRSLGRLRSRLESWLSA